MEGDTIIEVNGKTFNLREITNKIIIYLKEHPNAFKPRKFYECSYCLSIDMECDNCHKKLKGNILCTDYHSEADYFAHRHFCSRKCLIRYSVESAKKTKVMEVKKENLAPVEKRQLGIDD